MCKAMKESTATGAFARSSFTLGPSETAGECDDGLPTYVAHPQICIEVIAGIEDLEPTWSTMSCVR